MKLTGAASTVARAIAPLTPFGLLGGIAGRLRPPSEARAAAALAKLLPAALGGNLQAARAILFRTAIGIARERAVWAAAATQLPAALVTAATRQAAALDAATDHSNPESVVRSVLGTGTALARFLPRTFGRGFVEPEPITPPPMRRSSDLGQPAAKPSRQRKAKAKRARKARTVNRYNPSTGRKVKVPADSQEAADWPTRKPTRSKAVQRLERRVVSTVSSAVGRGVSRGAKAVAAIGLGGIGYGALAGLAAYAATTAVLEANRTGQTPRFLLDLAVAKAHRSFAQRAGRPVTRAELVDIRKRIAARLVDAISAGSAPPPIGALKTLISQLRGR